MDVTELIAWIGWAVTAAAWGWQAARLARRLRTAPPDATASRHQLDTWSAALHGPDGAIVVVRHGRGKVPDALVHRQVPYARLGVDPHESTLYHFRRM